jgi:hypothetical protein
MNRWKIRPPEPALAPRHATRLWSRVFLLAWLPPAWVLLGLCRLALLVVPLGRLAPRLGVPARNAPWVPLVCPRGRWQAARLGRAVRLAARLAPWRADCMPQALCARLLLGLLGIPCGLYLGVARDPANGSLLAHAWVMAGPVAVTGGAGFERFRVIAGFIAPGRWAGDGTRRGSS